MLTSIAAPADADAFAIMGTAQSHVRRNVLDRRTVIFERV